MKFCSGVGVNYDMVSLGLVFVCVNTEGLVIAELSRKFHAHTLLKKEGKICFVFAMQGNFIL